MIKKGLIQVYTGDGKGKTTASIGLSIRAAGADNKVMIIQLLKGMKTSEVKVLESIDNITVNRIATSKKFFFQMNENEQTICKNETKLGLDTAITKAINENYDVVIFDEILGAHEIGIVSKKQIEDIINNKLPCNEYIFTGRNAPEWLIEKADLVTEMKKIKHYYDAGQKARIGIEF